MQYNSNINSLKGASAFSVVIWHFCCAFYPRISLGDESLSHYGGGVERLLSQPPLFALCNGPFIVYIFWTISGYLLAKKCMCMKGNIASEMLKTILNKYFKFIPCIFLVNIFVYVVIKSGISINIAAAEISKSGWLSSWLHSASPIKDLLMGTFYTPWLRGASVYNGSLWTMCTELYDCFFLVCILLLAQNVKNRKRIFYLMGIMCFLINCDYLAFLAGAFIAEHEDEKSEESSFHRINFLICMVLFLISCFFGSCHSVIYMGQQIWLPDVLDYGLPYHTYGLLYVIGSALMVFLTIRIYSNKENVIIKWLWSRSFFIYVCHAPLLAFIGSFILMETSRWMNYFASTIFVFCGCAFVIGGVSEILYRIDKQISRWYQPLKLIEFK